MRKKTTLINEAARQRLGITRDEYALCSYIQYRQADRRGKAGWCVDPKKEIAEFVGVTRPGVYKMLDRLSSKELLYIDPATGGIQVTGEWIDNENDRKQSLHQSVNKVSTECKQSLHQSVNKVTHIKEEEKEDKGRVSESAHAQLNAEIPNEKTDGSAAAPPPLTQIQ